MRTKQQQRLQTTLDALVGDRPGLRILEAGCGSATMLRLPPEAYVTGLDISQRQLDRNQVLHEKILGDIQTHPLPESEFDLIICWDVLEHVPQPDRAVANLSRALREDGLLLLAMPNARSIKGLLTKCTPHRFHVWMYHNIYRQPLAGVDGRGPFPTYLRGSMAPAALGRLAQSRGLEIVHVSLTESVFQERIRGRLRLGGRPWDAIRRAVKSATVGRLSLDETEVGMILRRPNSRQPSVSEHEAIAVPA